MNDDTIADPDQPRPGEPQDERPDPEPPDAGPRPHEGDDDARTGPRPDPGAEPDSLTAAVFHLARLLARAERRDARGGFPVHRGRGRILALLALREQMAQKELAYLLGVRSQSLGEQLAELERSGLVRRTADPSDRRTSVVELTDDGRQAAADATAAAGDDPFAVLSADEQASLARLLDKVSTALHIDDAPPRRGPGRFGPFRFGPDGPWAGGPGPRGPAGPGPLGPEDPWDDGPGPRGPAGPGPRRGRGRRGFSPEADRRADDLRGRPRWGRAAGWA